MSKKTKPRSFLVTLKCRVTKLVVCEDCTEDEARNDPFEHATEDRELYLHDYEVTNVEENR